MNTKKPQEDEIFEAFNGQWDIEQPDLGHQERFLNRLNEPKKKRSQIRAWLAIAASVIIILGFFIGFQNRTEEQVAVLSPEAKETQQYFNLIIKEEIAQLKKENDPESKMILEDALRQMEALDLDYQKLTIELSEKGENKQIIHAMITNLQTRISFLKKVEEQIETIKKIKAKYHENNNL